jgi:hypothetical protein
VLSGVSEYIQLQVIRAPENLSRDSIAVKVISLISVAHMQGHIKLATFKANRRQILFLLHTNIHPLKKPSQSNATYHPSNTTTKLHHHASLRPRGHPSRRRLSAVHSRRKGLAECQLGRRVQVPSSLPTEHPRRGRQGGREAHRESVHSPGCDECTERPRIVMDEARGASCGV